MMRTIELDEDLQAIQDRFNAERWSDGLPIIPPTEARVEAMLAAWPSGVPDVLGAVGPSLDLATAKNVAANAVMAGCRPEWLPFVVAALQACLEEPYNLTAVQTTTHPCSTLVIVNGPGAAAAGLTGGFNALGAGNPANLCIGRAVRLALWNIGAARPPDGDRATLGGPAKITFCLAENEAESPWPSFAVSRGFAPEETVVTVHGGEGPHNVVDLDSRTADGVLTTLAESMAFTGANHYTLKGEMVLLLAPEHADLLAQAGMDRAAVQQALWERARRPLSAFSPDRVIAVRERRLGDMDGRTPLDTLIPVVERPDEILIVVAGGAGRHSAFVPSFGATRSVSRVVPGV